MLALDFFHSKRIPNSTRTRIKNIIELDSVNLVELGQLNKKIGYLFAQAINESIEQAKIKKTKLNVLRYLVKLLDMMLQVLIHFLCRLVIQMSSPMRQG
jgi:hypothetical protein